LWFLNSGVLLLGAMELKKNAVRTPIGILLSVTDGKFAKYGPCHLGVSVNYPISHALHLIILTLPHTIIYYQPT